MKHLMVKILQANRFSKRYKGYFICIYDNVLNKFIIPDWIERGYPQLDRNYISKVQAEEAAEKEGFKLIK